jgi:hypothetical protein
MLKYSGFNDDDDDNGNGKLEGLLLVLLSCHSLPCGQPHQSVPIPSGSKLTSALRNEMVK